MPDLNIKETLSFWVLFWIIIYLICLGVCYFIERSRGMFKKRFVTSILTLFLGLVFILFYTTRTVESNILWTSIISTIFFIISISILFIKPTKKKRRHFDETKQHVMKKQNQRCAHCRKKLKYGYDFDHKNNDRSNNHFSNCQVLCTACHRKKTFTI